MNRWITVLAYLGLSCIAGLACTARQQCADTEASRPRNLILIVIDTLRAEQLALYGGPTATPHLAELARRGVRFANAFSHAPITGPSHASVFTGLLPRDHGVRNNAQVLRPELTTLAELMKESGRRTAAFVSLQVLAEKYGFSQGFDEYHAKLPGFWWRSAGEVNAEVLPWLETHASAPFFLWVHYSDPHEPYLPPEWYERLDLRLDGKPAGQAWIDGRQVRVRLRLEPGENRLVLSRRRGRIVRFSRWWASNGVSLQPESGFSAAGEPSGAYHDLGPATEEGAVLLNNAASAPTNAELAFVAQIMLPEKDSVEGYGRETAYVDGKIGELFDRLGSLGLWDNTLVVLTADHGEELGERLGRFGHIQNLYDEAIHVPLVMAYGGCFPPGSVVKEVVRHVDLVPTIAELFALRPVPGARGKTLLPIEQIRSRDVVAETYKPEARADKRAVRFDGYKLIRNDTAETFELYALERDRGERSNLLRGRRGDDLPADLAAALERGRGLLETSSKAVAAAPISPALTVQDIDALRALGYVE